MRVAHHAGEAILDNADLRAEINPEIDVLGKISDRIDDEHDNKQPHRPRHAAMACVIDAKNSKNGQPKRHDHPVNRSGEKRHGGVFMSLSFATLRAPYELLVEYRRAFSSFRK